MRRITTIEINGKEYPMNFSVGATMAIEEKYGSINKFETIIASSNDGEEQGAISKSLEAVSFLLAALIAQGCKYKNDFESGMPIPENAPVVNGEWVPLTQEQIKVLVQPDEDELKFLVNKINECMNVGKKREVTAKGKGKNV